MLLLARAANDAAEPWGFSNFCIVAHPCAGLKKHGDILATTLKKRRRASPGYEKTHSARAKTSCARKRTKCVPLKEIAAMSLA